MIFFEGLKAKLPGYVHLSLLPFSTLRSFQCNAYYKLLNPRGIETSSIYSSQVECLVTKPQLLSLRTHTTNENGNLIYPNKLQVVAFFFKDG